MMSYLAAVELGGGLKPGLNFCGGDQVVSRGQLLEGRHLLHHSAVGLPGTLQEPLLTVN